MRLMHGKLSPFVRKVMIAAIEKGLEDRIEIVPTAVGAGKVNRELMQLNPTGKIPTLVLDDGASVYDSLVICDYLDSVKEEPKLVPSAGPARLSALRLNAIADGLLVAGVLAKGELSRPPEKQWPEWLDAQFAKVRQCVVALDQSIAVDGSRMSVGTIATICALGWLDFRVPEVTWRTGHPALAVWFDEQSKRDAVARTRPA
jgi:glutathione S-transferase